MSKVEHKVGKDVYAPRGYAAKDDVLYVIVGAPQIQGKRWVNIALLSGGPVVAIPEAEFEKRYRRVD